MSTTSGGAGISGGPKIPTVTNDPVPTADVDAAAPATAATAPVEATTAAAVPVDKYGVPLVKTDAGPQAVDTGMTPADRELGEKAFVVNGVALPFNAATTNKLNAQVKDTPEFKASVGALQKYQYNPTPANLNNFASKFTALMDANPNANVMELLFLVFRASIEDMNKDKEYYLYKLQDYNKMAQSLSDYLQYLTGVSQDLAAQSVNNSKANEIGIDYDTKSFDLTCLKSDGSVFSADTGTKHTTRSGLDNELKKVESDQTTVSNERELASNAFQSFDQKSNQLYNLLASVVKVMNDMRTSTVRNMM